MCWVSEPAESSHGRTLHSCGARNYHSTLKRWLGTKIFLHGVLFANLGVPPRTVSPSYPLKSTPRRVGRLGRWPQISINTALLPVFAWEETPNQIALRFKSATSAAATPRASEGCGSPVCTKHHKTPSYARDLKKKLQASGRKAVSASLLCGPGALIRNLFTDSSVTQ